MGKVTPKAKPHIRVKAKRKETSKANMKTQIGNPYRAQSETKQGDIRKNNSLRYELEETPCTEPGTEGARNSLIIGRNTLNSLERVERRNARYNNSST